MIRTEYTRQVPIKHWLPHIEWSEDRAEYVTYEPNFVITGYKVQRAWIADLTDRGVFGRRGNVVYKDEAELLMRGEEVEGFQWLDEPVKE